MRSMESCRPVEGDDVRLLREELIQLVIGEAHEEVELARSERGDRFEERGAGFGPLREVDVVLGAPLLEGHRLEPVEPAAVRAARVHLRKELASTRERASFRPAMRITSRMRSASVSIARFGAAILAATGASIFAFVFAFVFAGGFGFASRLGRETLGACRRELS
jgi:hypothetical protein